MVPSAGETNRKFERLMLHNKIVQQNSCPSEKEEKGAVLGTFIYDFELGTERYVPNKKKKKGRKGKKKKTKTNK